MPAKVFKFSVVDMRTDTVAPFEAEAETLEAAFRMGAAALPAVFGDKQAGLRMFRFRIENVKTAEFTACLGQGATLADAWADALKGTRETFRPKQDGKSREQNGLTVLLPPKPGDHFAKGRVVSRSVESFQSDETFAEEARRKALEAERARLAQQGRVA